MSNPYGRFGKSEFSRNDVGQGQSGGGGLGTTTTTSNTRSTAEGTIGHIIEKLPSTLFQPETSYNPFEFWNLDEDTLDDYSDAVQKGVDMAIERHHKGFNTATVSFNIILESFKDSQHKLHGLINNLIQCKKLISESIIAKNTDGKNDTNNNINTDDTTNTNTNTTTTTTTTTNNTANEMDMSSSKIEQMKILWQHSKEYKTKLMEFEKIEYYLQVPDIISVYIQNRQFVHAAVVISDALTLYVTDLFHIDQLKHHQQILLEKKNAMETVVLEELMNYLYLKDKDLRDKILNRKRPTRRSHEKRNQELGESKRTDVNNSKNRSSLHEDSHMIDARNKLLSRPGNAASNFSNAEALGMGFGVGIDLGLNRRGVESGMKRSRRSATGRGHGQQNIADPSKIVVPTYNTLKANKMDESQHSRRLRELLSSETQDSFLKDPMQNPSLFISVCVMATDKLIRSVPTMTRLHKNLGEEFQSILKREMQETQHRYAETHPGQVLSLEDQSELLKEGIENGFRVLLKVLQNHLAALSEFESAKQQTFEASANMARTKTPKSLGVDEQTKLRQYSKEAVWVMLQHICKSHLEKYLHESGSSNKDVPNPLEIGDNKGRPSVNDKTNADDDEQDEKELKPKRGFFGRMKKAKKSTIDKTNRNTVTNTNNNAGDGTEPNPDEEERQFDLSELKFSFADSTQKSIVHIAHEGDITTGGYLKGMREFAAESKAEDQRRLSLRSLNKSLLEQQARQNVGQNSRLFDTRLNPNVRPNIGNFYRGKGEIEWELVQTSPFHVTTLFRPVMHFVEQAEAILGVSEGEKEEKKDKEKDEKDKDNKDKDKDKEKEADKTKEKEKYKSELKDYLNNFVSTTFIQEMQAHVSGELGLILLDDNQLDHTTLQNELVVLPKSASRVYKLAEKVFTNFKQVPMFDSKAFVSINSQILTQCRKTYHWAFKYEVRPRLQALSLVHPSKDRPEELARNKEYVRNLSSYDLRKMLYTTKHEAIFKEKMALVRRNNRDSQAEYRVFQDLIGEYQKQWKSKADGGLTVFDMNVYLQLSLLCTGLYWVSQKLQKEQIYPFKAQLHPSRDSTSATGGAKPPNTAGKNVCEPIERYLLDNIEPLCEFYLAIIRLELRTQCVYYLSHIGNQSYVLHELSSKPQDFIIDLNKLLVKAEFELNECLPEYLVKFIFLELSYFICNILIQFIINVQHKRINKLGAKQLWRNIFSLQQNLTTITQEPQEKAFERPQKFLDLSQKTTEEIEKFKKLDNKMFQDYELEAVAKIAKLNM